MIRDFGLYGRFLYGFITANRILKIAIRFKIYKFLLNETMILSFHPLYVADKNLLCAGRDPGQDELTAIQQADVVILPQGCRESLYRMAADTCPHVFPNYEARFAYPEKIGQARLFQQIAVPFPYTIIFENKTIADTAIKKLLNQSPLESPFVFKFNWGGEGETVFLVRDNKDFDQYLQKVQLYARSGQYGFVLQEFIPSGGRSLRVVVIHETFMAYWRILDNDDGFYTNIAKGARLELDADPNLTTAAIAAPRQFCKKTSINLAGFDFLFSETDLKNDKIEPLFLEINYFFGRKGLGGSEKYYILLKEGIDSWLRSIKLNKQS